MLNGEKIISGFLVGIAVGLLPVAGWAKGTPETQGLIEAHRKAAVDARGKAAFHEDMEEKFQTGRGGGKIDMVGHCRFWAEEYRKLAAKEDLAAKELER